MSRPKAYIPYYDDFIEAMSGDGCAFCRLQRTAAERYIDALLWESVNDPRIRREISAARGFCKDHAWLLVRPGGALSSAIIYRDVVQGARRIVEDMAAGARESFWDRLRRPFQRNMKVEDTLVKALKPQQTCPVCSNAAIVDQHLATTVLDALAKSDDLLNHYRASAGLCLEHFRTLLSFAHQPAQRRALIDVQIEVWQALDIELAEFIRKSDHRFRGEKFGAERDAWERAIALTSGPQPPSHSSRGGITQTS